MHAEAIRMLLVFVVGLTPNQMVTQSTGAEPTVGLTSATPELTPVFALAGQ